MNYCPLGITISKKDGFAALNGMDLDTHVPVKAYIEKTKLSNLKLFYSYDIKYDTFADGFPELKIIEYAEKERLELSELKKILDYSSVSPNAALSGNKTRNIVKLGKDIKIMQSVGSVYLKATIVGIKDPKFDIYLNDFLWLNYWRSQRRYADTDLIENYMITKNIYTFVEKQTSKSDIECESVVIME